MILKTCFVFEFVLFKDDDLVAPFFSAVRMVHTARYTDVPIFADIETVDPDAPWCSGKAIKVYRYHFKGQNGGGALVFAFFYIRDLGRGLVRRRAYRRG